MRKYILSALSFLLILFTVLPSIAPLTAKAASKYAAGEYELPFVILKDSSDEKSMTNDYMKTPAKLHIDEDGEMLATVTLNNSSWWQYLKIQTTQPGTFKDGNFVDATVVNKDEAANTRVVQFKVQDIDQILNAKIHVIVTGIPGLNYDNKYDIRFKFDSKDIPLAGESGENTEEPDKESPGAEQPDQEDTDSESPTKPDDPKTEEPGTGNPDKENPDTEQPDTEEPTQPGEGESDSEGSQPDKPDTEAPNPDDSKGEDSETTIPDDPKEGENQNPEQPASDEIADGEYTIAFKALHAEEEKDSAMMRYIENPAALSVQAGKKKIDFVLKDQNLITTFQIEQAGEFVDGEVVNIDEDANTRTVRFAVDQLDTHIQAKASVYVPYANYHGNYDFRLALDKDSIAPKAEAPGTNNPDPEQPGTETPKPEDPKGEDTENPKPEDPQPEQPEVKDPETEKPNPIDPKKLEDGNYTIDYNVLKFNTKELSVMDDYVVRPGAIRVKDGKKYLAVTFKNSSWITDFKIKQNDKLVAPKLLSEDVEADTRVVEFEVTDLESLHDAWVKVDIPFINYHNEYDVHFAYDADSIERVKEDPKPGNPDGEEPKPENPQPENPKPENPKPENPNINKPAPKDPKDPVIDPKDLKDGEYSIGYRVLKANSQELSMMNDYVVSPGSLRVKDGKQYIAITLLHSSWITDFKIEKDGKLVVPKLLSVDEKADTRVVEFEVSDLFALLNAWVKVDITELNYHHDYDIHFAFDPETIQLLKAGEYPNEDKNPVIPPKEDPKKPGNNPKGKDPQNLKFDRNGDPIQDTNKTLIKKTEDKKQLNPKTADTTKMILFIILFVAALISLAARYYSHRKLQQ